MTGWTWLDVGFVHAIHAEQLAENGGGMGTRDEGLLQSALARPEQRAHYGNPPPDAAELAAAYSFGIARNHPFVDGNKRTAFVAGAVFMELNGYRMTASELDVVLTFLRLAAGEMTEAELAGWYRANSKVADARR